MEANALIPLRSGLVDLARRRVDRSDGILRLTPREAGLVQYLVARAPDVVPREELLAQVWGYGPAIRTRTLESTVHTLRTKIERDPRAPDHLLTVRGEGYRWVPLPSRVPALLGAVLSSPELDPEVRRLVARARTRALALDDPEAALDAMAMLENPDPAERAGLLLALGRVEEARQMLADVPGGAVERALLALRSGDLAHCEALLERARALDETRDRAEIRLAVVWLDQGRIDDGYALLEGVLARAAGVRPRFEALAAGEIGMYRLMQGHVDTALEHLERTRQVSIACRSTYLERVARAVLALTYRVLGDADEADHQRARVDATPERRWVEPGIHFFLALERRGAGDLEGARDHVAQGLARHAVRPNPADGGLLRALQWSWSEGGAPPDPAVLPPAPPFTRTLVRASWGEEVADELRVLDMKLVPRLLDWCGPP